MEPPDAYDRHYERLLVDSIAFLKLALDPIHWELSEAYSRHSIIDSLLILEAVSNTCLESLEVETSVLDDLDRLPVLAKYDIYLRTVFANRKLNKGLHTVAALRDLKILRDTFAHPRRQKIIWSSWSESASSAISEKTAILGVPRNPLFWGGNEALTVMRAVHDFLNYYFGTLCKFVPKRVTKLLFSEARRPNKQDYITPYWDHAMHKQLEDWRVNIKYVHIGALKDFGNSTAIRMGKRG